MRRARTILVVATAAAALGAALSAQRAAPEAPMRIEYEEMKGQLAR